MTISFRDLPKTEDVVLENLVTDSEWIDALSDLNEEELLKLASLSDGEVIDYIQEISDVKRYAKAGAKIHLITGAIGVVAGTAAGAVAGAALGAVQGAVAGAVRSASRRFGKQVDTLGRKIKDIGANIEKHNTPENDLKKKQVVRNVVIKKATIITEGVTDVNVIHKEEVYDLYDEVADLIENLDFLSPENYQWRNISISIRSLRDTILEVTPEEVPVPTDNPVFEAVEEIEEAYKAGSLKLKDGSTVKISKDDAKALNKMLSSTNEKDAMNDDVLNSKKSFDEILTFAKSINEEFVLDEVSKEYLDKYIWSALDQRDEIRVNIKNNPDTSKALKDHLKKVSDKRMAGIRLAGKKRNVSEDIALGAPALEPDPNTEEEKKKEKEPKDNG